MIRPARRKQTGMVPGNMMGEAHSGRLDRREWDGTGMGGIIQKGRRVC
jgi:hypothetical protein